MSVMSVRYEHKELQQNKIPLSSAMWSTNKCGAVTSAAISHRSFNWTSVSVNCWWVWLAKLLQTASVSFRLVKCRSVLTAVAHSKLPIRSQPSSFSCVNSRQLLLIASAPRSMDGRCSGLAPSVHSARILFSLHFWKIKFWVQIIFNKRMKWDSLFTWIVHGFFDCNFSRSGRQSRHVLRHSRAVMMVTKWPSNQQLSDLHTVSI